MQKKSRSYHIKLNKETESILIRLGVLDGRSLTTKENLSDVVRLAIIKAYGNPSTREQYLKYKLGRMEQEHQEETKAIVEEIREINKKVLPRIPLSKKNQESDH